MYIGYVQSFDRQEKKFVFLDVEKDPEFADSNESHVSPLLASIRVMRGGFTTHEYIPYFFRINDYDWSSLEMSLSDQGGLKMGAKFFLQFSSDYSAVTGTMRGSKGSASAQVHLFRYKKDLTFEALKKVFPELPEARALTGEYFGSCEGQSTVLQVFVLRSKETYRDAASYFPGFRIEARSFVRNRRSTSSLADKQKVSEWVLEEDFYGKVSPITFNSRTREMAIPFFRHGKKVCKFDGTFLNCGESCSFKKLPYDYRDISKDPYFPHSLRVSADQMSIEELLVQKKCNKYYRTKKNQGVYDAPGISMVRRGSPPRLDYLKSEVHGVYFGNLHVRLRDFYKPFFLSVDPNGRPVSGDLQSGLLTQRKLDLSSSVYVGELNDGFALDLSIEQAEMPKSSSFAGKIFSGSSDYELVVKGWTQNGIYGNLIAKSFGLIGSFELERKGDEFDMASHQFPHKLNRTAGKVHFRPRYYRRSAELALSPGGGPSYFPFQITGLLKEIDGYARQRLLGAFVDTTMDPFTGAFYARTQDGVTVAGKWSDSGPIGYGSSTLVFGTASLTRQTVRRSKQN
jgi:hypothetical protein